MFKDHELIGIPQRIVVSDRGLEKGSVEYKGRTDTEAQQIPLDDLLNFIKSKIGVQ
jgi:prolyl-tRNA synthetase